MTRALSLVTRQDVLPSRIDTIRQREAENAAEARAEALELERATADVLARHESMIDLQAAPVGVREASRSLARDLKGRLATFSLILARAR